MAPFSRNTIIQLVKAYEFSVHSQLDQLAMTYGLEDILGGEGIAQRDTRLMKYLIDHPELEGPRGAPLVFELIEHLFTENAKKEWDPAPAEDAFPDLVNALALDGCTVVEDALRAQLPEQVDLAEHQNEISSILEEHSVLVAVGHLDQAVAAHTRGDWAAANAQLRSFVEALFDRVADVLSSGSSVALGSSHARREWLAQGATPFFEPNLNEWELGDKGGFVQGFWKRLHPEGSHPGLSDEDDCTFRMQLVIVVASHFLRRFHERTT